MSEDAPQKERAKPQPLLHRNGDEGREASGWFGVLRRKEEAADKAEDAERWKADNVRREVVTNHKANQSINQNSAERTVDDEPRPDVDTNSLYELPTTKPVVPNASSRRVAKRQFLAVRNKKKERVGAQGSSLPCCE